MPSTGPLSQNSRLVATLCMLRSQRPAALLEPSPPDCMRLLFDHVHPPHLERINAHCYRLSVADHEHWWSGSADQLVGYASEEQALHAAASVGGNSH